MTFPISSARMGQRGREFHTWAATCVGYGVKKYVELGSWDGSSATFARQAGIEKVCTVDLLPDRPTTLREDIGYIVGNSHDVDTLHKVVNFLGGFPDAVFIDADHEEASVRADFKLWWPITELLIGFHDINELPGVQALWNEVSRNMRSVAITSIDEKSWQEFHKNSRCWGGIGILFKENGG